MLSRRAFLAGSSALTIAGSPIEVRAQGGGVRRSVRGMSLDDADLAAYARAVAAMKALRAGLEGVVSKRRNRKDPEQERCRENQDAPEQHRNWRRKFQPEVRQRRQCTPKYGPVAPGQ